MKTRTLVLATLAAVSQMTAQEQAVPSAPATPTQADTAVVAPAVPAPAAPEAVAVPAPAPAPVPVANVPEAPAPVAAPVVTKSKDTLSVDFPDEEVRTILRNVADLFELNLVIPDTLQGRTSLKLREVTWRQIFQVVLSPIGYTFVEDSNIIKIVSQDSLQAEPVSTEIFIINYAKADDIVKTITTLVDPAAGGKIIVDQRSNALVITERPSRMGRIRPIIDKLDRETAQVMIESKFIEVSDGDTKNLGVDWSSLSQAGIKSLSFKDNQVVNGSTAPGNVIPEGLTHPVPYITTFNSTNFSLFLNALQTKTKSRVVSNPTIVTLNNTEATINIGLQYPLPDYTYNAQTGAFAISGFTYKDIGINLKVTPQVNNQGFIRMALEPEISDLGDPVNLGAGAGGANIPIINTRKTKTAVSLEDGHTLGIGGLIKSSSKQSQSKVPFLGSIPILGRLFRTDSPSNDNTNLLIFITAKTISGKDAKLQEIFDPRAIKGADLKQSDLPGFRANEVSFTPETPVKADKKK